MYINFYGNAQAPRPRYARAPLPGCWLVAGYGQPVHGLVAVPCQLSEDVYVQTSARNKIVPLKISHTGRQEKSVETKTQHNCHIPGLTPGCGRQRKEKWK